MEEVVARVLNGEFNEDDIATVENKSCRISEIPGIALTYPSEDKSSEDKQGEIFEKDLERSYYENRDTTSGCEIESKKEKMDSNLSPPLESASQIDIRLKTKELSFMQKIAQVYWANPKSWLLDQIEFSGENIKIIRKDGNEFESKISEIKSFYSIDKFDRYELEIKSPDAKK